MGRNDGSKKRVNSDGKYLTLNQSQPFQMPSHITDTLKLMRALKDQLDKLGLVVATDSEESDDNSEAVDEPPTSFRRGTPAPRFDFARPPSLRFVCSNTCQFISEATVHTSALSAVLEAHIHRKKCHLGQVFIQSKHRR